MQPNDQAYGYQVNRIAAALNGINPIPLVMGPITVLGTTTLNSFVYTWPAVSATSGQFLQSNGTPGVLSWQTVVAGVTSVTGTANQVTASPTTGAVVVSLPSAGILPGTWHGATGFTIDAGDLNLSSGNAIIVGDLHAQRVIAGPLPLSWAGITGDVLANRGGTTPGTGAIYFGSSVAGTHNLYYDGTRFIFTDAIAINGDSGAGTAGQLHLTNASGIGNGANTNMQAPLKGTGAGPTTATLVTNWIKIYDGTTTKWIPAFT